MYYKHYLVNTNQHLLKTNNQALSLALNRFEPLTDIQVRHGKIPTSVLQGPFLASVAKLV